MKWNATHPIIEVNIGVRTFILHPTQYGSTPPPFNFPKYPIAFSKAKLDIWLRFVLAMDYLDKKVIRWSVSLSSL